MNYYLYFYQVYADAMLANIQLYTTVAIPVLIRMV